MPAHHAGLALPRPAPTPAAAARSLDGTGTCHRLPPADRSASVAPLLLDMPGAPSAACTGSPARHRDTAEADLALLLRAAEGKRPDRLLAPEDPDARARYRWTVGHHAAFAVWQMHARVLEAVAEASEPSEHTVRLAAHLYDVYSVLFLYTGSCSAERYAATVRADMTACHVAFSGEWARDHLPIPPLLRRIRDRHPASLVGEVAEAAKHNHRVHMAVAKKLVPDGASLLQEAGRRSGGAPSEDELALYDTYFRVRRTPVCRGFFTAQLTRLLAQCLCDIAVHGLNDADAAPARLGVQQNASIERLECEAIGILTRLATWLSSPTAPPQSSTTAPIPEKGARMSTADDVKTVAMTPPLYDYLLAHAEPPTPVQARLIDHTRALGGPAEMQIPHEQGVFLTLLARLMRARHIVEVGTFTGYSTLALALGQPTGGRVVTCDTSEEWTGIARDAWQAAGVADRIEVRLGPAADTLRELPGRQWIDMAFIDADKPGYRDYWEELVPRMRPGGLLLADNVLYGGEAADPEPTGNARAIRAFNDHVRADDRVEAVMLPLADGLTLARKRETTRPAAEKTS
ncbi:class I SAM-dependent methyltransferase [Streptomyces sp. NPDC054796]